MAKFKLLAGQYVDENKRVFKRGDVVETELDLGRMFRSGFERITDPTIPATSPVEEAFRAAAPKVPMNKEVEPPKATPAPARKKETLKPLVEATKVDRGRDVSKSFPKALEEDFRVFKKGSAYFVYDLDDLDKPLNDPGVEKRTEVNKFIVAYLKRKG